MSTKTPNVKFDRKYYESNYSNYEAQNPRKKLAFYKRVIEANMLAGVPLRIHDIGCAQGLFLQCLDSSWELFGSDISEFAIQRAAKILPHANLRCADAASRRVFDGSFGVITAWDVVEHIPDINAVIATVREQLVPNGLFVFVVPVYDGLSGPLIRMLDRDPTHVHKWPRQRWIDWARSQFEVVEWRGIMRYLITSSYYMHLPTTLFRDHTPAIMVVCRKRAT